MIVGAECQRRWREDQKLRLAAEQREYFARSNYHAEVTRVRASKGRDADALEDVEYSRREMARMDPNDEDDAPRVLHFKVPRPYRLQRKIISDVATWASMKFGKPISDGIVSSAWDVIKAVERDEDV